MSLRFDNFQFQTSDRIRIHSIDGMDRSIVRRRGRVKIYEKPNKHMNRCAENQTVKAILFAFGIVSVSLKLERAIANDIRSAKFKFDLSFANHGAARLT